MIRGFKNHISFFLICFPIFYKLQQINFHPSALVFFVYFYHLHIYFCLIKDFHYFHLLFIAKILLIGNSILNETVPDSSEQKKESKTECSWNFLFKGTLSWDFNFKICWLRGVIIAEKYLQNLEVVYKNVLSILVFSPLYLEAGKKPCRKWCETVP